MAPRISGDADERFEPVRSALATNFDEDAELGAPAAGLEAREEEAVAVAAGGGIEHMGLIGGRELCVANVVHAPLDDRVLDAEALGQFRHERHIQDGLGDVKQAFECHERQKTRAPFHGRVFPRDVPRVLDAAAGVVRAWGTPKKTGLF